MVTAARPLRLVDSSHIDGANDYRSTDRYGNELHDIRVAVEAAGSPQRLRAILIWEMHNALNRGAAARSRLRHTPPSGMQDRWDAAAHALSIEWDEWGKLLEAEVRKMKIDSDMRQFASGKRKGQNDGMAQQNLRDMVRFGGDESAERSYITDEFLPNFDEESPSTWRHFSNYLNVQLYAGHTASIDRAAGQPNWAGLAIYGVAFRKFPGAFVINSREVEDFINGKRRAFKRDSTNPFKNVSVVEDAYRETMSAHTESSASASPPEYPVNTERQPSENSKRKAEDSPGVEGERRVGHGPSEWA
jgi:hypothetical protein